MTKHRSHSAAFKRQVAEEFIGLCCNLWLRVRIPMMPPGYSNAHPRIGLI